MVGGVVIGVVARGDEALLTVADARHANDECAVRCGLRRADDGRPVSVQPGDQVWWQCGKVYWTPTGSLCRYTDADDAFTGKVADIPLPKIGYSH